MTVLVQRDVINLSRPSRTLDEHGWANDAVLTPAGHLNGTIQEATPISDPQATDAGGHGPNKPMQMRQAVAYLEVAVTPGDHLTYKGTTWRATNVHLVEDPRQSGLLDCWVVDCIEVTAHV